MWAIDDRDGFSSRYAKAREALMDKWSEEIVNIADDQTAEPNDRRVRVDTRKRLMSKLSYRKFGDKLVHSAIPTTRSWSCTRRCAWTCCCRTS
jgi:terminase small subunit-like protein